MMKLLLLTLCFVYAQCRPDLPPAEVMKEKWNQAMDKALKRKFGDSYTASPDDACSQGCQKAPPPDLGQYLIKLRDPAVNDIADLYNKEVLIKLCTYANETASCVKSCPDTQRRAFLREIFAPVKYLCVDSHFLQNADCYKEALEEAAPGCWAGVCAEKKAEMHETYYTYRDSEPKTKENAETFFAYMCSFFKCEINCGDAIRTQKCGEQANNEFHNFYREVAKSFEAIRLLSPRDYVIDVPRSCKVAA